MIEGKFTSLFLSHRNKSPLKNVSSFSGLQYWSAFLADFCGVEGVLIVSATFCSFLIYFDGASKFWHTFFLWLLLVISATICFKTSHCCTVIIFLLRGTGIPSFACSLNVSSHYPIPPKSLLLLKADGITDGCFCCCEFVSFFKFKNRRRSEEGRDEASKIAWPYVSSIKLLTARCIWHAMGLVYMACNGRNWTNYMHGHALSSLYATPHLHSGCVEMYFTSIHDVEMYFSWPCRGSLRNDWASAWRIIFVILYMIGQTFWKGMFNICPLKC